MRIDLTESALADLGDVWLFLARRSERQANRTVEQIIACIRQLEVTPLMGRDVSHLRKGLRRHRCDKYLVFYRISGEFVEVLHVLHGHRDLEAFFG